LPPFRTRRSSDLRGHTATPDTRAPVRRVGMESRWKERVMRANRWLALASALLLVTAAAASSLMQGAKATPQVVRMALRVVVTPTSGPSREGASADVELAVGQSKQ